jgi:hypothetical protein
MIILCFYRIFAQNARFMITLANIALEFSGEARFAAEDYEN